MKSEILIFKSPPALRLRRAGETNEKLQAQIPKHVWVFGF